MMQQVKYDALKIGAGYPLQPYLGAAFLYRRRWHLKYRQRRAGLSRGCSKRGFASHKRCANRRKEYTETIYWGCCIGCGYWASNSGNKPFKYNDNFWSFRDSFGLVPRWIGSIWTSGIEFIRCRCGRNGCEGCIINTISQAVFTYFGTCCWERGNLRSYGGYYYRNYKCEQEAIQII